MRLAGVDDRLKLRIRQQRADIGGQHRAIARPGRRDRSHCRRLHQLGRVGLRTWNTDRLQSVGLVDRLGEVRALGRRPVHDVIGQLYALGIGADGNRTRCRCTEKVAAHGFWRGGDRRDVGG